MPKNKGGELSVIEIDALLSFYLHLNTTALSDIEWAKAWNKLQFALKFDGDRYASANL